MMYSLAYALTGEFVKSATAPSGLYTLQLQNDNTLWCKSQFTDFFQIGGYVSLTTDIKIDEFVGGVNVTQVVIQNMVGKQQKWVQHDLDTALTYMVNGGDINVIPGWGIYDYTQESLKQGGAIGPSSKEAASQ